MARHSDCGALETDYGALGEKSTSRSSGENGRRNGARTLSVEFGPTLTIEACGAEVTHCRGEHPEAPLAPLACGCCPLHTDSPVCHRCSCLECERERREFRAELRQLGPIQLRLDV